jgi:hypothetical protein
MDCGLYTLHSEKNIYCFITAGCVFNFKSTRWFKYERDDLCVNKSQFVPVIFEPPCKLYIQGGSNMTGTDFCVNKPHLSRSYLNHLVRVTTLDL